MYSRAAYRIFSILISMLFMASVQAQPLGGMRTFQPVVFSGAELEPLQGIAPDSIAAFRYDSTGWTRIPSQIDEREYIDLAWAYNGRNNARCDTSSVGCFEQTDVVFATVYMDPETFTGPDSDPFFDADDELVFMARDAGARAPTTAPLPEGVFGPAGVEVRVSVPRTDASRPRPSYVYLFHHDGRYAAVDTAYVAYDYNLLSGDYFETYNIFGIPNVDDPGEMPGANPEDSWVETPYYRRHFLDRWIEDELRILEGDGVDILDRYRWQKKPDSCDRTDWTASSANGAMIANISGPVRAIRSIIGFNSGPFRVRESTFYDHYATSVDYFRVHSIVGMVDFFDRSPGAIGMTYTSNVLAPRVIDGVPDGASSGVLTWEMLQGTQGTLVTAFHLTTTITDLELTSYYYDEAPATTVQCTGDDSAYGASGPYVTSRMPNTDPARGAYEDLTFGWHQLYASPDLSSEEALDFVDAVSSEPLFTRARQMAISAPAPALPPTGGFLRAADAAPAFALRLDPPRPNPVADQATLPYELAAEGPVRLEVYDALGRRVAVVEPGWSSAGRHAAVVETGAWASGVYVVRLVTDDGARAVRLVKR